MSPGLWPSMAGRRLRERGCGLVAGRQPVRSAVLIAQLLPVLCSVLGTGRRAGSELRPLLLLCHQASSRTNGPERGLANEENALPLSAQLH